ncbi:MAG: ATP-grasp domain-containing protein [Eggerthellaceae bacterium]|nr:ATP-grasp domain-containing protein [Eggerthellaceae bacterium]
MPNEIPNTCGAGDYDSRSLLILGASFLQVPMIEKAKKLGLRVGVLDMDPSAPGIGLADEFFEVSTNDPAGVCEAARRFGADGICTMATDMPVRSIAYACAELGLPGPSWHSAVAATDKGEMARLFAERDVAHPAFRVVGRKAILDRTFWVPESYPVITKPVDSSGSRGVVKVEQRSDYEEALRYSSESGRSGDVIVEEYIAGPEVSVELMVVDGAPHVVQVTDKETTGAPHFVEIGHSQPSQLPEKVSRAIRHQACAAALAVGIENGPAHAELRMSETGPKVIEIGARLGGDLITSHLVPLSTGVDLIELVIRTALGLSVVIPDVANRGSAVRFLFAEPGVIESVGGIPAAGDMEGLEAIGVNCEAGDVVSELLSSSARLGYVVCSGDTADEAKGRCARAAEAIEIVVRA